VNTAASGKIKKEHDENQRNANQRTAADSVVPL
jgi:hypothetical protein